MIHFDSCCDISLHHTQQTLDVETLFGLFCANVVDNGPTLVSTKACWVPALQGASMSGCRLLFVLQTLRPNQIKNKGWVNVGPPSVTPHSAWRQTLHGNPILG